MTLHAPTDVRSITVPGGCGHPHDAGDLADGERMSIDCPPCEAVIGKTPSMGWGTHPHHATLTCDERAEAARVADQAQRVGMANLAALAGGQIGAAAATPSGTADALVAALQAQNVALAAQLEALSEKVAALSGATVTGSGGTAGGDAEVSIYGVDQAAVTKSDGSLVLDAPDGDVEAGKAAKPAKKTAKKTTE